MRTGTGWETDADSVKVIVMSPIDVDVALDNVALENERLHALHQPQIAHRAVRLYAAALNLQVQGLSG